MDTHDDFTKLRRYTRAEVPATLRIRDTR
ncbi:MAG: hypothetical protein JWQ74_3631, partial [Marmoricola sp.]|nr:hypothetical protein [Marmoricola sp.]